MNTYESDNRCSSIAGWLIWHSEVSHSDLFMDYDEALRERGVMDTVEPVSKERWRKLMEEAKGRR